MHENINARLTTCRDSFANAAKNLVNIARELDAIEDGCAVPRDLHRRVLAEVGTVVVHAAALLDAACRDVGGSNSGGTPPVALLGLIPSAESPSVTGAVQ